MAITTPKKKKWKPIFSLEMLSDLPTDLQKEGEKIGEVYRAIQNVSTNLCESLAIGTGKPYAKFLKLDINQLAIETSSHLTALSDEGGREKSYWYVFPEMMVLQTTINAHDSIDRAYGFLKTRDIADFAIWLSSAGSYFGELKLMQYLLGEGVLDRIGSIKSALSGAESGGKKSGETRRKQSTVPTPDALKAARQLLIEAGKPPREIAAMLANKYRCTTDHIRKTLKRD